MSDKDTIYRQAAIDAVHKNYDTILDFKSDGRTVADSFEDIINALPPTQPEIIYCKDCRRHNISPRKDPENCCPLYHYRGMSFGNEHDFQFCSYAKRKGDS